MCVISADVDVGYSGAQDALQERRPRGHAGEVAHPHLSRLSRGEFRIHPEEVRAHMLLIRIMSQRMQ
jgi:hypothetical protein